MTKKIIKLCLIAHYEEGYVTFTVGEEQGTNKMVPNPIYDATSQTAMYKREKVWEKSIVISITQDPLTRNFTVIFQNGVETEIAYHAAESWIWEEV